MRLLLAALAVAATPLAAPLAASADPTACATTINSKGVETTVCNPGRPSQNEPWCRHYQPGPDLRVLPYVRVCFAP